MGGLFSACDTKKSKTPTPGTISQIDRAVLDLKNARDKLSRYRTKLSSDEKKLLEKARVYFQKEENRTKALHVLRLRKHKLREAENVDNQLLKILEMVDTIVSKENEREILDAMTNGKAALEELHKEMSVDDILDLLEGIREGGEVEKEINGILAGGAALSSEDEADIEKELEELEAGLTTVQAANADDAVVVTKGEEKVELPVMPEAPTGDLPEITTAVGEKEDKEMPAAASPVLVAS